MFEYDKTTGAVTMHQGDTGSYYVHCQRKSGTPWTENDRMILTIGPRDDPVIQRYYRLDRADTGNGRILIEFKNADTDHVPTGNYPMERRYVINPTWELDEGASIPTEDCANALTSGARIIDGPIVRVPKYGQSSLTLTDIYGEV